MLWILTTFLTVVVFNLSVIPPAFAQRFVLSWTDNSTNESGFEVERSVEGGAFTRAGQVGSNVTQWTDTTDTSKLTCYRVRAYLTAQNTTYHSAYSNTACGVHLPSPTGAVVTVAIAP